jgi:hypothetical protein
MMPKALGFILILFVVSAAAQSPDKILKQAEKALVEAVLLFKGGGGQPGHSLLRLSQVSN